MGPPPAGFLIEPLFVAFDTIPTKEVLLIVRIDELDHVIGFTIAPFATMDFCAFYSQVVTAPSLFRISYPSLSIFRLRFSSTSSLRFNISSN